MADQPAPNGKQIPPKDTVIKKQKFSRAVTTGYECANCGVMNVTYDGSVPDRCLNCDATTLTKKFQDIVTNIVTIEKVL